MQANGTTKNASVHSNAGSTSRHAVRRSCATMDAVGTKGARRLYAGTVSAA